MTNIFKNFIQIAGVIDQQEADLLINCGVEFLGFPLRLPVNKEDLTEEQASNIIKNLDSPNKGLLITYLSQADEIKEFCDYLGTDIVQLHGPISLDELQKLKQTNPEIIIIKSLVVREGNFNQLEKDVSEMNEYVDAFITDTFDPITGASGATGKTHDWSISRSLVELSPKPVILAGGLNADNVYDAILQVKPAGVDTHTGVEKTDGRKDPELVKRFIENATKAFNEIS